MTTNDVIIKNISIFQGHDGIGLNADIYIRGRKVAHVFDEARGGMFDYTILGNNQQERDENRNLFNELESHLKTLPKRVFDIGNGRTIETDYTIDTLIDELFSKIEKEKEKKKIIKKCETAILYGKPNGSSYRILDFKKSLKEIASTKIGKALIQRHYNEVKFKLQQGEEVFNENLREIGIVL